MVLYWLFGIGIICLGLATCFGWKYALIPSKFNYELYEKWVFKYEQKHPKAEKLEGEKRLKEYPNSAPIDFPLEKMYLKRVILGKKAMIIFTGVGGILTAIASVL